MARAKPRDRDRYRQRAWAWIVEVRPAVGQVLPGPPWLYERRATAAACWAAAEDLLAEWSLAAVPLPGEQDAGERLVLPAETRDPVLWQILRDDSAAAAAAFVDRLQEVHGVEPSPRLREWVAARTRDEADARAQEVLAQAQEEVVRRLPAPARGRLDELPGLIAAAHGEVLAACRTTLDHARRVGDLLREAKRFIGHGNFIRWVNEKVPFSPRTAQDYMCISARWAEVQGLANTRPAAYLGLREGLRLLAVHRDGQAAPAPGPPAGGPVGGPDPDGAPDPVGDDGDGLDHPDDLLPDPTPLLDAVPELRPAYEAAEARAEAAEAEAAELAGLRRAEAERARQDRWRAEQRAREEAREASFDLTRATADLRDLLQSARDRWPAARRVEFVAAARAALEGLP
jgi:hypothetical protein